MAARDLALCVEGVSHSYGPRKALDQVSVSVAPGRFVALLGLNGAGKSTLFSLVTRLFAIQTGSIRLFGHDVIRQPGEALRLHGIGAREARTRADDVLARIALADRANDKVRDLSGGQMRRVEIARALLHRPRLLILDEPTVGLDIKARAAILQHVRQLVAEGVSVLW